MPEKAQAHPGSAAGSGGAPPLIAIVDDEAALREVLCRAFERAGFLTASCALPSAALALARARRPEVFLIDMMMPEMTGAELCRRLRAEAGPAHPIIVLMTGAVQDAEQSEAVVAGLAGGADDYLFKPLNLAETVARIGAWLRVERSREQFARKAQLAGAALLREQAYNQAILSSMADALLVVAGDGTIRSCNRRAPELLGRRPEEIIGRPLPAFLAASARNPDDLGRALARGEVRDYDAVVQRPDGSSLPVSLSCAPFAAEGSAAPEIVLIARDISDRKRLEEQQRQHAEQLEGRAQRAQEYAEVVLRSTGPRSTLIGQSRAMQRVREFVRDAAGAPSPVLILGESGTGKEVVARAIHANGPRAEQPFVVLDCSAVQGSLLDSELFGHEKGAYTGADAAKAGLVEVAGGGTLFVDELGEMPIELQAKLLRVLETGEFRRVGSAKPGQADLRVIAATNRDLAAEARKKRFRADLLFRLNVLAVTLPPLRERRGDVPLLAQHFLDNSRVTMTGRKRFRPEALRCLQAYDWPGNVRELANVVERAVIISGALANLEPGHLPPEVRQSAKQPSGAIRARSLAEVEKEAVAAALAATGGNKTRAAKLLGIARITLREKLDLYGIPDPKK